MVALAGIASPMNHVASHPEGALNLLIIEKSPNTAERLANVLRNAGVAVHMVQAINEAECREAWQAEAPDIILFAHPHSKLDFSRLMQLHDQQSSDAPVIVISNDPQLPELISALEEGAHDVVYSENNQHLALAVARSQESLYLHRQLARTHDKLAEAEDRCNSLIDSSRDAIAFAHEGMHMYANRVYLEMFGFVDQEDIEGLPLLDMIAPERHAEIKKFLRTFGNSDDKYAELETVCLGSDGKPFDAKLEFSPVSYDGEACTQLLIRDQSQSKDLEQKLQEISNIDVETGLFNRQYLSQQMETGLENGNYKTLLYINLENYEEIRASAGLSACDKIMKELADITQSSCADDSLGGRFNEHTIAILSRSDNSENIEAAAARFCETVESHSFDSVEQLVNPVCRIGIAYSSQAKHDAQDLVHQAYQACELASEQQSCFASYDPSHDLPSASDAKGEDSDVVKLIDYALEHDHFRLVFQPIVSLQGDSRENYAVLLRLLDANNEEMRPADFFPQAEAAGLMAKIDRWVIRNAIKELSKQRAQGRKTNFFISLTGASLEDDELALWICDRLRDAKVKGGWIIFQLSDQIARQHLQVAKKLVDGLQKIRIQFAIDRFGSSSKPESLLKHLPVNFIKMDPALMDGLATNQENQDKMNTLNELAHSYNIKTVATGVEDANSLAILWTVGVNYIQGYFLQEPSSNIGYDFDSK